MQFGCGLGEYRFVAVAEALPDVLGNRVRVGIEYRAGPPAPHHLVEAVDVEGLDDLGKGGMEIFFERGAVLSVKQD